MKITSLQNDYVKHLVKLRQKKYRDEVNEILLEGEHLRQEILDAKIPHKKIGITPDNDVVISEHIAEKISSTKSGSTQFTLVDKPKSVLDLSGTRYLIVDGVQDPGNLGTMIRTAYSFGFDAIVISDDSVDEFNDKCIRSTQGAIFHIPCVRGNLIEIIGAMKRSKISVYATYLSDDTLDLSEVDTETSVALVMGHEGRGVSPEVIAISDNTVKIETSRFESLNVAIATGIVCYTFRK